MPDKPTVTANVHFADREFKTGASVLNGMRTVTFDVGPITFFVDGDYETLTRAARSIYEIGHTIHRIADQIPQEDR